MYLSNHLLRKHEVSLNNVFVVSILYSNNTNTVYSVMIILVFAQFCPSSILTHTQVQQFCCSMKFNGVLFLLTAKT